MARLSDNIEPLVTLGRIGSGEETFIFLSRHRAGNSRGHIGAPFIGRGEHGGRISISQPFPFDQRTFFAVYSGPPHLGEATLEHFLRLGKSAERIIPVA